MSFISSIHSFPPPFQIALSTPLRFSHLSIFIQPLASWSSWPSVFPSSICLSVSTRPLQVSGRGAVYSSRSSRRSSPREAPEKPSDLAITNERTHSNVLQSICGFIFGLPPHLGASSPVTGGHGVEPGSSAVVSPWGTRSRLRCRYHGVRRTSYSQTLLSIRRGTDSRGIIPAAQADITASHIAAYYGLAISILNVRRWRHVRSRG
jgi:hypothetical protein